MAEPNNPDYDSVEAAEATVDSKRRFSVIWIVPITAALIGAWLVYKAETEKGPTVSITFSEAQGVEAGKTKVKYKDVIVGEVNEVELSDDLKKVTFTASLDKTLEGRLSENSQFWIVSPRFAGGSISGLGTLLSGVYIGLEPGEKGKPKSHFEGLKEPPLVSAGTPGRHFVLTSKSLGSVDLGSPVYFRQLKAGQVESYKLEPDGTTVRIRVFVHAPFDQYVYKTTRFWNASGISASISAEGITVSSESVVAILLGGIAFDTKESGDSLKAAEEEREFNLFASKRAADAPVFKERYPLLMYFTGSVRGLSIGAPVQLRGIDLGEVTNIELEGDPTNFTFRIPVTIEYEPGRIKLVHDRIKMLEDIDVPSSLELRKKSLQQFVDHGLRAQLKTGSLLTGQLYVDLDFYPDEPPAEVYVKNGVAVFPTVAGELQKIQTGLTELMEQLQKIPFEKIGKELSETMRGANELVNSEELRQSLKHLNQTLANSQQFAAQLNEQTAPALEKTLNEAISTLATLQQTYVQEDSPVAFELTRTLTELSSAARSVRQLADYLERNPDALIKGK
jgi:paraquat-inducible protein B